MPRSEIPARATRARLRKLLYAGLCTAAATVLVGAAVKADDQGNHEEQFTLLTTMQVPPTTDNTCTSGLGVNGIKAFDISFVDPTLDNYFLADRTNCSVDVYSTDSNTFLYRVGGFVGASPGGFDLSGPDGVLTVSHSQVWAGDGDSTVKIIDLASKSIVATVSTGGTKRADEMALDPRDGIVVVANDADAPPFLSFISTTAPYNVLGTLPFANATNGLEQPAWSPRTGLFYLSVPELNHVVGQGEIAVIDPNTRAIVKTFPVSCEPAGLALGPENEAFVGCSDGPVQVINIRSGAHIRSFPQVGFADEVWFNPGDGHFFSASGSNVVNGTPTPVLGVIDAQTKQFDENVPTAVGDHSVAADQLRNHVFLPSQATSSNPQCSNGCIEVFACQARHGGHGDTADNGHGHGHGHGNDCQSHGEGD
ncbi:MAG TPA: hypothetical protein VM755_19250 [Stellaceae bacterium]|nr:hypothetical protein [Stellaceae bacterium]